MVPRWTLAMLGAASGTISRVRQFHELRMAHDEASLSSDTKDQARSRVAEEHSLIVELLNAERDIVLDQWKKGDISSEVR